MTAARQHMQTLSADRNDGEKGERGQSGESLNTRFHEPTPKLHDNRKCNCFVTRRQRFVNEFCVS
jgi:hypothetical protein